MKLEDLEVYSLSMDLGKECWDTIFKWKHFERHTLGSQWIRAIDSVAANISEGFGRFSYTDSRRFLYIARGSLYESKTWLSKSHERALINTEKYNELLTKYERLGVKLNNYIAIHTKQIQSVNNQSQ